jgi:hypothetical protein
MRIEYGGKCERMESLLCIIESSKINVKFEKFVFLPNKLKSLFKLLKGKWNKCSELNAISQSKQYKSMMYSCRISIVKAT